MSRRRKAVKREILPDPRYKDMVLAKFVRALMIDGKKNTAEKLIYSSFDILDKRQKDKSPIEIFKAAIENVQPQIETRSRRVVELLIKSQLKFLLEENKHWQLDG